MGVPRAVRNTLISIVVLLAVIVGGGVAYTYFLGPDGTQTADAITAPVEAPAPQPAIKPTQPAADAKVSASVSMITSPVAPGSNSSVAIKTNAGAACKISVVYDKVETKDSGLTPKTADEFGTVSWAWTVGSSVPLGKWPVKVTCTNVKGDKSAVVQADLVVAKPEE
jgi:hypothetical protein